MDILIKEIIYYLLKYVDIKHSYINLAIGKDRITLYGNILPSNLAMYENRSLISTDFQYLNYRSIRDTVKQDDIRNALLKEINKMLLLIGISHSHYIGYGQSINTLKIEKRI